ncbi:MAG: ribose-phosphate pyrophosphokinase [Betaproteobacteria bacterium]|nr:MAG: ribose-phosphate pyrophosphokinase [Betaproteobacteria bacterium]
MLFALNASRALGLRVAEALGASLAAHEERDFEDGEHKVRPLDCVSGRDVYVVQSLYGEAGQSVNDKLVRLLFLLGAIRDAGAARVTALVPYFAYARKDARTQPNDPLTTRYVAQLIEALGVDCVLALEVHNPAAFQNAFRIRAEHLSCTGAFAALLASRTDQNVVVVSPDPGGFKRADQLRLSLGRRLGREVGLALMEKRRAHGKMTAGRLVGEVAGMTAIIVDDIVASGGTLAAAAAACRAQGAKDVVAAAAHGLFVSPANQVLATDAISRILVTDSVPPFRLDAETFRDRIEIVSIAPLIAQAVGRLNSGGSLADLAA